ncbi:MAG: ADOP family duplicated permease [Terriglobales bacterium]
MLRELHHAWRHARRSPAYALTSVLLLALGLAAATAVFSIVNGVLLQPLPYRNPGRLVALELNIPAMAKTFPAMPLNPAIYLAWSREAKTLAGISLVDEGESMNLTGAGRPELASTDAATRGLFDLLGVPMQLGHGFDAHAQHEVILTDALWRRRFRADPNVVGRTVELDGAPYAVVGVLPGWFHFPTQNKLVTIEADTPPAELFVPAVFTPQELALGGGFGYATLARLQPGVSAAAAKAELDGILRRQFTGFKALHVTAILTPLRSMIVRGARRGLWMLLAAVLALLLILCVNLANLALTRATAREREAAIRSALGASRGRLLQEALAEMMLVALAGGALGLGLAQSALRGLVALAPSGLPRAADVHLNGPVLWFALAAAVDSGLVAGLLPAWRWARAQPQQALRAGGARSGDSGGRSLRGMLVAVGTALSAMLLIAAGLLLASFIKLAHVPTGFAVEHILTVNLQLPAAQYTQAALRRGFWQNLLAAADALPSVRSAALTNWLPLGGELNDDPVSALGDRRPNAERPFASYRWVSPAFFLTLGIPLLRGRNLAAADAGTNAAVISEATAQEVWPGSDPIGQRFDVDAHFSGYRVVGVVGNTRAKSLDRAAAPMVYVYQEGGLARSLILQTRMPAAAIAPELRRAVAGIDAGVAVPALVSMGQIVANSLAQRRFESLLCVLFAGAALLLACLGIFGVVSYSVERQRPEIGVRMALGARKSDVLRLVMGQGMKPVLAGLAAGLLAAVGLMRLLASLLYGVRPADPWVFGAVAVVLGAVALGACYVPARRAAEADPLAALRQG